MKKLIVLFWLFPALALGYANGNILLYEKVNVQSSNQASIERGAKLFAQTCMSCHTMKYLQHNAVAKSLGITLDKMPLKIKTWFLGITPPDLTLIAKRRTPAWLYTYFHAFYKDPKRPTGYNNLAYPNTVMINIFAPMQGVQVLKPYGQALVEGKGFRRKHHYYNMLELVERGSMTPAEFDRVTMDLVNFLVYASDPGKLEREHIGVWVILFLVLLAVFAYLWKRSFWRDVQ